VSGIQWVRTGAVVKAFFKCFKGRIALIGKVPGGTLEGKMHKWNSDFRISINEMMVEIGKTEEGLDILDFLGFQPVLDDLDFVWGHGEAFQRQHVSEIFTGSGMEIAFVCMGKKSVSAESVEYFQNMGFVLRYVVRINEYVIQICDDYDINHIHKNVVHKSLKCSGKLVSPSGLTNHSKEL